MFAKCVLKFTLLALAATASLAEEQANVVETKSPTPEDKRQPPIPASEEENAVLIVAKNILIFEGKSTTWADLAEELDRRAGTRGGDLQTVRYYRTRAVYDDELRSQEARNWAQMLTDTSGVDVRQGGVIFNQAAERYDVLEITDQWPPGAENPVSGRVVDAEGNPIADAEVVLLPPPPAKSRLRGRQSVSLRDGQVTRVTDHILQHSDEQGKFQFDFPTSNTSVLVAAPAGFALVAATSGGEDIQLAPWSRVTVTLPQSKKMGVQTPSLLITATPTGGGPSTRIGLSQGSPDTPQQEFQFLAVPANLEVRASRTLWDEQESGAMIGHRQGQPYTFTTEPGVTHHLEFERLEQAEKWRTSAD